MFNVFTHKHTTNTRHRFTDLDADIVEHQTLSDRQSPFARSGMSTGQPISAMPGKIHRESSGNTLSEFNYSQS